MNQGHYGRNPLCMRFSRRRQLNARGYGKDQQGQHGGVAVRRVVPCRHGRKRLWNRESVVRAPVHSHACR